MSGPSKQEPFGPLRNTASGTSALLGREDVSTDPLAAQFHAAFQAFRVRLTTGDGFLDANGVLYLDTLLGSTEWQQAVAGADRFARETGLPPFAESAP